MELAESRASEIKMLHNDIMGHLRQSLDNAIRIGELLTEQKESLQHGEWLPWVRDNLPFSDRTARRYVKVYSQKDKLANVTDLKKAYFLLAYGDIEAECCRGRHVDMKKWGTDYCIDFCHGQCKAFNRGEDLPSGGLCGHPSASEYGSPPPNEWCWAYERAKKRLAEGDTLEAENPGWCPYNYIWTDTMKGCPRDA